MALLLLKRMASEQELINAFMMITLGREMIEPPEDIELEYEIHPYDENRNIIKFSISSSNVITHRTWTNVELNIVYEVTKDPTEIITQFWNNIIKQLV